MTAVKRPFAIPDRSVGTDIRRRFSNIPKQQFKESKETAIPRNISLSINLKLLSWYLEDNLPQLLPAHFKTTPLVTAHSQQGWSNYTFIVTNHEERGFIVRMKRREPDKDSTISNHSRWSDYHKEHWIMNNVSDGVPVAGTLKQGIGYIRQQDSIVEYAYMIQSYLPFQARSETENQQARLAFLTQLGRIASLINSTATKGFGRRFNPETETFDCKSWEQFISQEIKRHSPQELVTAGTLSERQYSQISNRMDELKRLRFEPTLFHADFLCNWSNILADSLNQIRGIIDWELAGSGPGKHYELATALYVLHRDGKSTEDRNVEFNAILNGYGITAAEYQADYQRDVENIMLLHAIGKLQRYNALQSRGELQQHAWRMKFAQRAKRLVQDLA